ncbi:MAG: hypothetical protein SFZ03_05490 [Candidatus Melainabacteria bacterium]|nr:hypothetical protein [Candidatus Melainabacteria bacterium]
MTTEFRAWTPPAGVQIPYSDRGVRAFESDTQFMLTDPDWGSPIMMNKSDGILGYDPSTNEYVMNMWVRGEYGGPIGSFRVDESGDTGTRIRTDGLTTLPAGFPGVIEGTNPWNVVYTDGASSPALDAEAPAPVLLPDVPIKLPEGTQAPAEPSLLERLMPDLRQQDGF